MWPPPIGRNGSSGPLASPTTVATRPALACLAASAVLLPAAPAARAASSSRAGPARSTTTSTVADIRAQRAALMLRIATLTDQTEGVDADVVAAELRADSAE